ncbi:nuclear transport factor 2 family protein [Micromonospora sp. WMMD998]|uniref:nuclear transport factor 2 family protein n=1 Tax=Micromonospora sp. WMMD998 TaxID=3016092 RepID=UPI00249BAECB|nr:nuclear transport factor 2 family protein [Micromonospora sp. WMMD998]WFE40006.1 nuclear transport factor 2 family protein [Micromonospora sp. WMMD998]
MTAPGPDAARSRLAGLYQAFNARDMPTLLAAMTPDVCWPNGWEGGVLHGRAEVSAYWRRQWAEIEPSVTPTAFTEEADGRVAVSVRQVVRDKAGAKLANDTVTHVYRLVDGLVAEMEIRPRP